MASIDAVGLSRLPALFHDAGFEVSVMCPPRRAMLASRYVSHWRRVNGGAAAVARALVDQIELLAEQFDLFVPCDEPLLKAVSALPEYGRLSALPGFFPPDRDLSVYLDKVLYLQQARDAHLPVPAFEVCSTRETARNAALRLGFPVILKRSVSMSGSGVQLLRDMDDLNRQIPEGKIHAPFLIQQFVIGKVGASTLLANHGRLVRSLSFYMLHCWPNAFSPSGGGRFLAEPLLDELSRRVTMQGMFHGLCSIDWIEEEATGKFYLLEFNPRVTPSAYLGARVGADFSEALAEMSSGAEPVPHFGTHSDETFTMFPEAAFRAIDDRNWLLLGQSLSAAPFSDPWRALALLRRVMTHYLPKTWRRDAIWARIKHRLFSRTRKEAVV